MIEATLTRIPCVDTRASSSAEKGALVSLEVQILGVILATLQVLDGTLTAIGIHIDGTSAEGNLLLRALMENIGRTK